MELPRSSEGSSSSARKAADCAKASKPSWSTNGAHSCQTSCAEPASRAHYGGCGTNGARAWRAKPPRRASSTLGCSVSRLEATCRARLTRGLSSLVLESSRGTIGATHEADAVAKLASRTAIASLRVHPEISNGAGITRIATWLSRDQALNARYTSS